MNIGTIATLCSLIDDKFSLVLSLSGKSHVHILLIINFSFSFYLKLPLVSFDKPPFETGIPERNCKFPARLHKSIGFINHYCRLNPRSEEHTSELQSRGHLVCRLLLEKKKDT